MNLLLNDEEMKALRPDVPACGQTVFECDSCSGGCPLVAKAQLKKVVEYLDTLGFYDDWGGESGKAIRDSIKQTILKELENGSNEVS